MPAKFPIFERPVVLIDFDDVLAEFDGWKGWHHLGPPRPGAQKFVAEFKTHDWVTVLWTGRADTGLLVDWLRRHEFSDPKIGTGIGGIGDLTIDYINTHPEGHLFGMNPSKPAADLIIDNTAWPWNGRPVDLDCVMKSLKETGYLDWRTYKPGRETSKVITT